MKLLDEYKEHQAIFNKGFRFDPVDETFFAHDTKTFVHPEGYEDWKVKKIKLDEYFAERMKELALTDKDYTTDIFDKDNNRVPMAIFQPNKYGDIEILQYSLHRRAHTYQKKTTSAGTTFEYCVQKRLNPIYEAYCAGKYDFSEAVNKPFWPPQLIEAFENGDQLDYLVITEGQFKAFKAAKDGIPTVGLTSITHFRDGDTAELHTEIIEFIHKCGVKKLVILWDGDCRNISISAIEKQEDLAIRPGLFYKMAKNIRTSLQKISNLKKLLIFHATIKSNSIDESPKGIDDLLLIKRIRTTDIVIDFERIGEIPGYYINWIDITKETGVKELRSYYLLDSVHKFYHHHGELIKGKKFIFFGNTYKVENNVPVIEVSADLKEYKLIGTDYYRLMQVTVPIGKEGETTLEERLVPWKADVIKLQHGKDSLYKIEYYKGFTNIPNHLDYQQVLNNEWNLYANVKHDKKDGEFPTIRKLLKHVFQEHYDNEMILDYITILYRRPVQKLPIIALLSEEQGTGKSTFVFLMKLIFKQNMAIVSNSEITGEFNSHWISKLVVACEETIFDKKDAYEKLKQFTTQKFFTRNEKNKSQAEIALNLHFILCSNHENDFMKISKYDRRLWVRKVHPFKQQHEDADVTFDQRLEEEIPQFIHFIENREIKYKERGELYFHQKDFQTNAFFNLVDASEPGIVKDIKEVLLDYFMTHGGKEVHLTAKDLRQYFHIKGDFNYINKVVNQWFRAERRKNEKGKEISTTYNFIIEDLSDPSTHRVIKGKGRPYIFRADMVLKEELVEYSDNQIKMFNQ